MTARADHQVVLDASAIVALLADAGSAGDWVAASISGAVLAAPELALFEAANIFRRQMLLEHSIRHKLHWPTEDLVALVT